MPPEPNAIAARKVEAKPRGNALGFWFFKQQLRFFGLRGAYFMLSIVAAYCLVFDADVRSRAMAYVRRRFPRSGLFGRMNAVYRIFISQGRHFIDHFAMNSGAVAFDLKLENKDVIKKIGASSKGCILLTSHVGNWQIAMPAFAQVDKKVYLIMRPEDNRAVAESMGIDRETSQIHLISPESDFGGAIEIVKVLNEGAVVSMMGDRRYEFDSVKVPSFLGAPALFPYGAFHIAAACRVPVVIFLSAKTGPQQYTVSISKTIYPVYQPGKPKKEQITQWVQEYANVLEEFLLKYPYQCFIFNDVWQEQ
jgi:predicted LPLAT superfamily acyltransferase